ncbi:MAG: glycosyltransferase family 2 protein [Sphingobacteriaceae bacterium]|nr:glycosyltransferase family 2 protein [Sphingobacteriaceae bacterium]
MNASPIAVVILNYNGKKLLEQFLPGVVQHSNPHQIYIADNCSTDDSLAFIKNHFPTVKIIQNKSNLGYAGGYNEALKDLSEKYFMLLNNDVEVTENWLTPLLELLEKNIKIAACQPKMLAFNKKNEFEYAGASGGFIDKYGYPFCRGRLFYELEKDNGQYNSVEEVFWASGACLFVRADLFNKNNGFDSDLFAHMEEIDLCWRFKNLGYSIFVQPQSIIYHVGGGTLNKISPNKTFLNFRNNLIMFTKNHPPGLLFFKIIWRLKLDGVAAIKFLLSGEGMHFIAVIRAHFAFYAQLSNTLSKRKKQKEFENFKFNFSNVYMKNIVFEFYLNRKKKFSELNTRLFSKS